MSAITENDDERAEPGDVDGEFQRLKMDVIKARRMRGDFVKEATRAFDFVAGHQWSEEDTKLLESQKRPPVTFNRTAPIVKAVCGLEVNSRQDIAYLPREQGDAGVNEVITAAAKWVRDECDAPEEESLAFRDLAICGEGWTDTRMELDTNLDCPIIEERVDPLEMGANAGAQRKNYSDARMIYRVRDLDGYEVEALFADLGLTADAVDASWINDLATPADGGEGFKKDYPNETRPGLERIGQRLAKARVVQIQWWERQKVHLVAQQGVEETQELSPEDFATFEERAKQVNASGAIDPATGQLQQIIYESAEVPQKVYYQAFLGRSSIIDKKKIEMGMFTFRCMTGERDRKKKMFYGMLRDMFDPQMWANKWLSQTMNIMNSNAKGGLMAEKSAFDNVRKAEKDWSDPTKIVWLKDGKLDKVKERAAFQLPQGLSDLMVFAIGSLRDVSGINLELLGQADREQAASLEQQRRQSAMTILATLFDSLRSYRKGQGKLLLHFIWLLPDDTLVRVTDKGMVKYIPLVKDKSVEKYDVIIDETPSSPNQKQAVWAFITQMLQSGVQLSPPSVIKLLEYSPLPETVAAEISKLEGLDQEDLPPHILKQKLEQAEAAIHVMEGKVQEMTQEAKEAEGDKTVEMVKLLIEDFKAETARLQAEWTAKHDASVNAQKDADAVQTPTEQHELNL